MTMLQINLWHGDCRDRLKGLADNSVDLVLCDPPYDLTFGSGKGGFMGMSWDATGIAFDPDLWRDAFRILRPDGWAKVFSATRTFHRVCKAMEDAKFQGIKDNLEAWTYGSGFPKSLNISKALDKMAKAEREVVGYKRGVGGENLNDIVRGSSVRQTTDKGGKGVGAYGVGAKQVAVDVPVTLPATDLAKLWDGYGTALKPAFEPIVCGRKPG